MGKRKWTNTSLVEWSANRSLKCTTDIDVISSPSTSKVDWVCSICNHNWTTTIDSVVNLRSGCPNCAGNIKQTVDDCQERLNHDNRNITVVKLYDGKAKHERKGRFLCRVCNTEWDMILSNLFGKKQGCSTCGKSGKYTEHWFEKFESRKTDSGKIYVILLESGVERFIKVGITKRDIKSRFTTSIPYVVTEIVVFDMSLYQAFVTEQQVLKKFKHLKYLPQKHFGGKNECFDIKSIDDITKTIKDRFNEFKKTQHPI
jgi:hypothetical protein